MVFVLNFGMGLGIWGVEEFIFWLVIVFGDRIDWGVLLLLFNMWLRIRVDMIIVVVDIMNSMYIK